MTTVQTENLRRKIAATQKVADIAKADAAEPLGGAFIEAVVELTPKDTNRLANAWIDAGNKAGISDRPLMPLNRSSRHDEYLRQLQEEMVGFATLISRAQGWIDYYERLDRTDGIKKDGTPRKKRTRQRYYKKQLRYKAKAEQRLDRVIEEYEKALGSDHIIFFNREDFIQRKSNRSFSTVRDIVYGGSGRVFFDGTRMVIELISHEPHGNPVEKHPHLGHPVATAKQLVRSAGIRPVSRAYKATLRAKSPMGNRSGSLGSDLGGGLLKSTG